MAGLEENHDITASDFRGREVPVIVHAYPDACPKCGRSIDAQLLHAYLDAIGDDSGLLRAVFRCPSLSCRFVFFGVYEATGEVDLSEGTFSEPYPVKTYGLRTCEPVHPVSPIIPKRVRSLSKDFAAVYTQASMAMSLSLDQIAGPGYGKALEFLIKDYLISRSEQYGLDEAHIRKAPLAACVGYLKDPSLKAAAKRAAWLRNDETHYDRVWRGRDIDDLKRLLEMTLNAINNALLLEEYEREMPDDQK